MADHSRSSEQQEADHAAASKGCGMFDFLKKKPEEAPLSPDHAGVTKHQEKPERLHDSDISSSDEEVGENGEKKEKKKKKEKMKVCGLGKEDAGDQCETEEKKGIMEKMKEKLPEAKDHHDDQVKKPEHEDGKEKGFMEKMKEKLPGGKPEAETHQDKSKEKGFMEKIKEKLSKHEDNDDKKKET
ncbi:hypothetical protein AALP_AA7G262100 [Arabis alpina]|uniref:Dehydrin n=1 Tax=Arabis alpina TaxID=50452 RepID=A0A087GKP4_ARAAL|nr:hypothetical protein AALP_AA7G262100 [Arabis alpina]